MDDDLLIEELGTLMLAFSKDPNKHAFKKRLDQLYMSGDVGDEAYYIIGQALGLPPRKTARNELDSDNPVFRRPSMGSSRPSYNDYSSCGGSPSYGSSC